MNDTEKIHSFGDMVDATDKLAAPWRKANFVQTIALVVTNLLWAIIVAMLIWFAYMTPIEADQQQDFGNQTQSQSYSEGVTNGK